MEVTDEVFESPASIVFDQAEKGTNIMVFRTVSAPGWRWSVF
jgi:ornithine carbamoyltransferase